MGVKEHEWIDIIDDWEQKRKWEVKLRYLWKSCFSDPIQYEDFYFDKMYVKNKVYAMSDKGMLHVNPYRCRVLSQEITLPYIVGVATDEQYRRQGVMRCLLEKVISDLEREGIPFTYLMPADERYYKEFDFYTVSEAMEIQVSNTAFAYKKCMRYMSYTEVKKLSDTEKKALFNKVENWLRKQYDIYAIHDESYYDFLYAEKSCQNGDVVFCFRTEAGVEVLCGVFAYALDDRDVPCVEQLVVLPEERIDCRKIKNDGLSQHNQEMICNYFAEYEQIKVVISYPYMMRIVNREAFLGLFQEKLLESSKTACEDMTGEQLLQKLFKEKDSIYFAEIV